MNKLLSKIAICTLLVAGIGCKKNNDFTDRPQIEWRDYEFSFLGDSTSNRRIVKLTVFFTDGNGDIGREELVNPDDSCNTDFYDLFIYYYEKTDGSYTEVPPADTCLPFHQVLPDLKPEGQNKTLEGDITTVFDYAAFPANAGTDSIKFEVKLKDRAGKESQRVSSPPIPVPEL